MVPIDTDELSWSLEKMSRYPFFEDSKKYIKKEGPSIDELLNDRMWGMVRIRGKERVLEAVENREVKIKNMSEEIDYEIELFSYPVSRILVSCVAEPYLVRRYCLGEANRMHQELSKESGANLLKISKEIGIEKIEELDRGKYDFKMYFVDFLENTNNLKAKEWKLINQDVRNGYVYLDKKKYIRILKERIYEMISKGLPRPINDTLTSRFESEIKEIKHLLEETKSDIEEVDMGKVEFDLFPPCIQKLISLQNEGENLSHEARFAVTSFLHKVGLSEDEIYQQYASNLQKYNSTQWYLTVNQSKNPTSSLDDGAYTYQAFATDTGSNEASTEQRTIYINVDPTPPVPETSTFIFFTIGSLIILGFIFYKRRYNN